jgi:hypothetical protein
MVTDNADRMHCDLIVRNGDAMVCDFAATTIPNCSRPEEPPPPPEQCTMLGTCCQRVTNQDDRRECEAIVQSADGSDCEDAQDEYCEEEPPSGQPAACRSLQMCCSDVQNQGDRQVCEQTAMGTDARACEQATSRFCMEDDTEPSQQNACEMLRGCCATRNLFDRPACELIAQAGVAGDCTSAAMNYCN